MVVTDVRVCRDDLAPAIRCFASEFLVAIDTDPPAAGPEVQLTFALAADQVVSTLVEAGIEVLASRER